LLQDTPIVKDVRCRDEDGIIVLEGNLPTYYSKQVAQTLVMSLGVIVNNQIVVPEKEK
jgi:hypothetical protein